MLQVYAYSLPDQDYSAILARFRKMFGFNQGSHISDSYVKNRRHTHMAMKMLAYDLLDTGVFLKDLTGAF